MDALLAASISSLGSCSLTSSRGPSLHSSALAGEVRVLRAQLDARGGAAASINAVDSNGDSALHVAAGRGAIELLQALLDRGADARAANNEGTTPLHQAAAAGSVECVKALMSRGADPAHANAAGLTPAHWAAAAGQVAVLEELGRAAPARAPTALLRPGTPLHVAAALGKTSSIRTLLHVGASCRATDADGATPLHYAAEEGQVQAIQELLAAGADRDARTAQGLTPFILALRNGHLAAAAVLEGVDPAGVGTGEAADSRIARRREELRHAAASPPEPPAAQPSEEAVAELHRAAAEGDVETLSRLVAVVGPGAVNGEGLTPLHRAAAANQGRCIAALLAAGADGDARNRKGSTPLLWAASEGHAEAVRALLNWGADPDAAIASSGVTPLHWACSEGHVAAVRALLAGGASLRARDHKGRTALHRAAALGRTEVMKALLKAGANVNDPECEASEASGATALHRAATGASPPHAEAVSLLLRAGAQPSAKDKEGDTPLHWILDAWAQAPEASREGLLAAARALVTSGANPTLANLQGHTPLELVQELRVRQHSSQLTELERLLRLAAKAAAQKAAQRPQQAQQPPQRPRDPPAAPPQPVWLQPQMLPEAVREQLRSSSSLREESLRQATSFPAGGGMMPGVDTPDCCICMRQPREVTLAPCGHQSTCQSCTELIMRLPRPLCPICRAQVDRFSREAHI